MAFVDMKEQIAHLTSLCSQLCSQIVERSTMQNVPTVGVSYGQGYEDWSHHSISTWREPQQAQHEGYWQPYEDFYAPPQLPLHSSPNNSGSLIDHNAILQDLLDSLTQGKETQQVQQETCWQPYEEYYPQPQPQVYWQPYEESYARPYEEFYAPSQPPAQPAQTKSGSSIDNDQIFQLLTSMAQGMQTRDQKVDELEKHVGQIADFMKQLVEDESQASNSSQNMDELLLQEEEEEDIGTAREEPTLPHPPQVLTPPTSSKVAPNSIISDLVPPIVPSPCRFLQSTQDEDKQDILDTLPTIQGKDVVEEHLDFKQEGIGEDHTAHALKIPHLAENSPCDFVQSDATFEPSLQPLGEPPTPIPIPISINRVLPSFVQALKQIHVGGSIDMDLRKDLYPLPYKDPMLESFEEHVVEDVFEFFVHHIGKPPPKISNSFFTNLLLKSMIQAPSLEYKPLPDHFKYHLPFKEPFQAVGLIQA